MTIFETGCNAEVSGEYSVLVPSLPSTRGIQLEELMIKKVKEGYKVVSEKSGKNLGGPYKTKAQAVKRLQQVEFFKRRKG